MKKLIYIALFFFTSLCLAYSQSDSIGLLCGTEIVDSLRNIPVKTPGSSDFLRCLIVYITFPDDTLSSYNYTIWPSILQSQNPRPVNPYSGTNGHLIDSLVGNPSDPFMTRFHSYTLSDFFCEMSMGQYDVIGDEIAITLPRNSLYYKDSLNIQPAQGRAYMNRYILNYLDSTRNIDWSRYDNWKKVNNEWVFEPDGTAEMIIMNYRRIPNNSNGWFWDQSYGGEASLSIADITFDGVTIRSFNGITALNLLHSTGRSEALLEHEFSHKIFGTTVPHSDTQGHLNMGFMTRGHNETSYLYTPVERSASVIDYSPINLINSTGIYTDTLPDFVESGVSYKIKIPGTTDDYIWLANHQKKSVYDGIARGGANCYSTNFAEIEPYCSDGKGLVIYREGAGCSNINEPYDITSAEGKFTWGVDTLIYVPHQNYHHSLAQLLPILEKLHGKRFTGKDKYRKAPSANAYGTWINDDECSDFANDYFISHSYRGDSFDPFNMGYEEIFSPYSNPSSSFCDSGNIGLTVALQEQNSTTGVIIVKIYYNNNTDALLDLPPSKPKNVKATKHFFGGYNSIYFHPEITWDQNIEPDFYNAEPYNGPNGVAPKYEIYRGSSTDCGAVPSYTLIATLASDVTSFIDTNVTLHTFAPSDPECPPTLWTYSYKVAAKDNRSLYSLKSERALVSGYINGCGMSEDNLISNGNSSPDKFSVKIILILLIL